MQSIERGCERDEGRNEVPAIWSHAKAPQRPGTTPGASAAAAFSLTRSSIVGTSCPPRGTHSKRDGLLPAPPPAWWPRPLLPAAWPPGCAPCPSRRTLSALGIDPLLLGLRPGAVGARGGNPSRDRFLPPADRALGETASSPGQSPSSGSGAPGAERGFCHALAASATPGERTAPIARLHSSSTRDMASGDLRGAGLGERMLSLRAGVMGTAAIGGWGAKAGKMGASGVSSTGLGWGGAGEGEGTTLVWWLGG